MVSSRQVKEQEFRFLLGFDLKQGFAGDRKAIARRDGIAIHVKLAPDHLKPGASASLERILDFLPSLGTAQIELGFLLDLDRAVAPVMGGGEHEIARA